MEGVTISAHLSIPEIFVKGREAVESQIYAFLRIGDNSLDLHWDRVQLRLVSNWVHLNSTANIHTAKFFFFEHQSAVQATKANPNPQGRTKFVKPKKGPAISFLWPEALWRVIEEEAQNMKHPVQVCVPLSEAIHY